MVGKVGALEYAPYEECNFLLRNRGRFQTILGYRYWRLLCILSFKQSREKSDVTLVIGLWRGTQGDSELRRPLF